jgi:hypothetical protein
MGIGALQGTHIEDDTGGGQGFGSARKRGLALGIEGRLSMLIPSLEMPDYTTTGAWELP